MIQTLIVGFVFLVSITAQANTGGALQKLIALASAQGKVPTGVVTRNLFGAVAASGSQAAGIVKSDPLYRFRGGNLDEESLVHLGQDAQTALIQIGRNTAFKSVMGLPESKLALRSIRNLDEFDIRIPEQKVQLAVNPEQAIEAEVRSLGLTEGVTAELTQELKAIRNELDLSYTNKGMCKGLDDEAATNFTAFLKEARQNLKRTRANCPNQLYGSIAEAWIQFQKRMGRDGDALWRAVQKNQTCYTSARLRPGVLKAVDQISAKNGGRVPAGDEPTGCPL